MKNLQKQKENNLKTENKELLLLSHSKNELHLLLIKLKIKTLIIN